MTSFGHATPRVLLVEDDPISCAFLRAATEALPARIDVATTSAGAYAAAHDGDHALWLLDANLSDGTGAQLLARLRAAGRTTVALAHTADASADVRARLLDAGFADVLVKPIDSMRWQAALRTVLGIAAPASATMATSHAESVPVWDDAIARSALAGNIANIAALRGLFLAELPRQRDAVLRGDVAARRAELHRLQAGCGFVGAARLGAAVSALHADPTAPSMLREFADAVAATLAQADAPPS